MLIEEKILYLKEYLLQENNNYGDIVKSELYQDFFEYNIHKFNFLDNLKTKEEIKSKIEFIISKFILHEEEDTLNEILNEYLFVS